MSIRISSLDRPPRASRAGWLLAGAITLGTAFAQSPRPAAPSVTASSANPAAIDWVQLDGYAIARTETTVGQFRRHAQATGLVTQAERAGGGEVYEAGWARKPGWTWQRPYGERLATDDEPAVHLSFGEAQAFCTEVGIPVLAAIPAHEDIRRKSANYEIVGIPNTQWGPMFETLATNVADAPPVRPKPLTQDQLLGLFAGDVVGRNVVLEPATVFDMVGRNDVAKPSLEVVYDTV